ncbi:MAG: guanylate kinase [Clostridia bacterium]|nr:guanylate kinase [Clostridia bacterium]
MKKGLLFVISGPSGTGKGTVMKHLLETGEYFYSVSATTRAPRPEDKEGVTYYFVTREQFEEKIAAGEMLEYAQYSGNYYGTPKSAVEKALAEGKNVILEIETLGALQVREKMPEAVLIFILPPDIETLRARLEGRGTETAEVIDLRMAQVKREVALLSRYDYAIVNENGKALEAAEEIMLIAHTERLLTKRNPELAKNFEEYIS